LEVAQNAQILLLSIHVATYVTGSVKWLDD